MEYSSYSTGNMHNSQSSSSQQSKILSCAECRRAKLRCDRQFPCESCRKRGLDHLCPNEALTTRPKNFLADAEELRQENLRLKERIRQLEGSLMRLQARLSRETQPGHISGSGTSSTAWAPPTNHGRCSSA